MTDIAAKVKEIDIKTLISKETNQSFQKNGKTYFLDVCPFCESGKGENGTPAFNCPMNQNIFKCFSCDKKGTTIDFILHFKKFTENKDAINYLSDNHLNGAKYVDTTNENTEKTDISKRIFQIKKNDIAPATEYLKSRGIDTSLLPKDSYFYNPAYKEIPESIVFFDSKEAVINQRYFKENEYNGKKTKFRNTGEMNGAIYDKMYQKDKDKVYFNESPINSLSMPKYSSIALFSSTNKIDNPELLRPYTDGKIVVLCGDNDTNKAKAGQNFNAYYFDILTKHKFCKEVQILQLPEKTDCNDLLQQNKLDAFLEDANSYKSVQTVVPEVKKNEKPAKKEGHTIFHLAKRYLTKHYDFKYNVIKMLIDYKKKDSQKFEILESINNIWIEIHEAGITIGEKKLDAILNSDYVPRYNPFLEYYESLPKWDKKTDYIAEFCNYISLIDNDKEYFYTMLKKWLVRVVATSLNNKQKQYVNKQCIVFVSFGQDSGKSTLCRWFIPESLKSYYTEDLTQTKDTLISLAQCFLVNIDELANLSKHDIDFTKSLFSREVINARPPYGKKTIDMPRVCSFIGSTNKTDFLVDETGSVRWLCFELVENGINWNYSKNISIDNLYSQAYELYKSGFDAKMTKEETKYNDSKNLRFQKLTQEREFIARFTKPSTKENVSNGKVGHYFMTASDVLLKLTELTDKKITLNYTQIGKALTMLKYPKGYNKFKEHGYFIEVLAKTTDCIEEYQDSKTDSSNPYLDPYIDFPIK